MDTAKLEEIKIQPWFELEDFMNFSKENRLDNATLEKLGEYWENWSRLLKAVRISAKENSWLAVWLPAEVEQAVDEAWNALPNKGFMLNNLAQYMCMTAVAEVSPQIAELGCAPTPAPNPSLRQGLQTLGLASGEGALLSRYAVVTWHPFRGGCEKCALSGDCPRQAGDAFSSVVLPGHER